MRQERVCDKALQQQRDYNRPVPVFTVWRGATQEKRDTARVFAMPLAIPRQSYVLAFTRSSFHKHPLNIEKLTGVAFGGTSLTSNGPVFG